MGAGWRASHAGVYGVGRYHRGSFAGVREAAWRCELSGVEWLCSEPDQPDEKDDEMAKSLDAELAAIEAEERKLTERRKAHQGRLREAAIQSVEKAGLLKLPLDRLDGLMRVVKTLGVEEVEKRLKASA